MNKTQIRILVLGLLVLSALSSFSQSRKFENIVDLRLQSTGVIEREGEVSGYYMFYSIGNAKKGLKTFILQILDENLNDVNTTSLEVSKRSLLIDAKFNGENILMKMWDAKNMKISYLSFDTKGQLINTKEVPQASGQMYVVNNTGFVDFPKELKSKNFSTRYIPNYTSDGSTSAGWEVESPVQKKLVSYGDILCVTDEMIVTLISNKRTASGARIEFEIQGLKISDGSEVFRRSLGGNYNNQPFLGFYDDVKKQINILGLYYDPEVRALKDNGIGMFNMEMNLKGEITDEKYMAWTNEFRDFMKIDNSGRVTSEDRKGFMFFHKIIRHEDGSIIAVAEQYQKVADAAGIALNVLSMAMGGGSAGSTTKIQVYDMVLFHFNPDFTIRNVQFVEKTKSNITLPEGYDFANVHLLAQYVNSINGFDYLFTTQNKKEGTTSIAYLDYVAREQDEPRQWTFNAMTLYDDEFTSDKIKVGRPSDVKNMRILPAKPGNIVILEYNRKDETLEVYLEKINY